MFFEDGAIQSANVPVKSNTRKTNDYGLYRCMVTKVLFVNDPQNITRNAQNPEVLYDVVVLGGFASGQVISNCRLSSFLGGVNGYFERVLQASTRDITRDRLSDHDGDVVLVQFVQGRSGFPIIVSMANGLNTKGLIGASSADGPRLRSQYNGVFEEINSSGEWCFLRKGGKLNTDTGVFEANEDGPAEAELKFLDNIMYWKDPNSSITFRKEEIQWEHIVGIEDSVYKELIDGKEEKTTRTYKSGLTIEEDGKNDKVTITTNGGATILIDGNNDTIEIKDNDTGKLKITGNTVALGADGIEVLQQISEHLQSVATAFGVVANHVHTAGNLGYPTSPPDTSFTNAWTTSQSELQAIKAKIDQIKGSL